MTIITSLILTACLFCNVLIFINIKNNNIRYQTLVNRLIDLEADHTKLFIQVQKQTVQRNTNEQ
jgi:hypothetical protein